MVKKRKRVMLEFSPIQDAEAGVMDEFKDELNALAEGLAAQHRTTLWSSVNECVPPLVRRRAGRATAASSH